MNICIYIYTRTCIFVHTYVYKHTCIYMYIYTSQEYLRVLLSSTIHLGYQPKRGLLVRDSFLGPAAIISAFLPSK